MMKIYLFGIFLGSLTTLHAAKAESEFALEWIGLILLAFTGFIFIFRSARQIKKIKKLQEELDTYQTAVSQELNTIGEKNV